MCLLCCVVVLLTVLNFKFKNTYLIQKMIFNLTVFLFPNLNGHKTKKTKLFKCI